MFEEWDRPGIWRGWKGILKYTNTQTFDEQIRKSANFLCPMKLYHVVILHCKGQKGSENPFKSEIRPRISEKYVIRQETIGGYLS